MAYPPWPPPSQERSMFQTGSLGCASCTALYITRDSHVDNHSEGPEKSYIKRSCLTLSK